MVNFINITYILVLYAAVLCNGLRIVCGGIRTFLAHNTRESMKEMFASLDLSSICLRDFARLVLSSEFNFVDVYSERCRSMTKGEFDTLLLWTLEENNQRIYDVIFSQKCVSQFSFRHTAVQRLKLHGIYRHVGQLSTLSESNWVEMLSPEAEAPTTVKYWCSAVPLRVLTSERFFAKTDLALHMSSFCLYTSYSNRGLLLRTLEKQLEHLPSTSITRLILNCKLHGDETDVAAMMRRHLCQARSKSPLNQFNSKYYCNLEFSVDGLKALLKIHPKSRSFSEDFKCVLLRMALSAGDQMEAFNLLQGVNVTKIAQREFGLLLEYINLYSEDSDQRVATKGLLGLSETDFVIHYPESNIKASLHLFHQLSTKDVFEYYRHYLHQLPRARDVNNDDARMIKPGIYNAEIDDFEMLNEALWKIIKHQNLVAMTYTEDDISIIRPRTWLSTETIADILDIVIYGWVRFDKPMVYLDAQYCLALFDGRSTMRTIIEEDYKYFSRLRFAADMPFLDTFKWRSVDTSRQFHDSIQPNLSKQVKSIKNVSKNWRFDQVMGPKRLCTLLTIRQSAPRIELL